MVSVEAIQLWSSASLELSLNTGVRFVNSKDFFATGIFG
jgi:hypothetical protein